jgi:hypothetical protein
MADSAQQCNPQHWLRLQPRRDERFLRAEGTAEARAAGRSGVGCIGSSGGSLEWRAFRSGTFFRMKRVSSSNDICCVIRGSS